MDGEEEALAIEASARADDAAGALEAIGRFFAELDTDPRPIVIQGEHGSIDVDLHPAAEPIRIERVSEDELYLIAPTHAVGPGYHRFVCETIDALAEATKIEWEVDDEYFADRDSARLEKRFFDWLALMANATLARAEEGARGFSWCTLDDHVFAHEGFIATQLGPRDRAWVESVCDDPKCGIDFFPWWNAGKDGAYWLGLARVWMWSHVRWRAPLDENERSLLDRIATYVERAHALDPSLEIPWREQSEILVYSSEQSLRATRAHLAAERVSSMPSIGYRRRRVIRELNRGWSLAIPGELAERWEDRGTWVAWDQTRSIFFNSFTARTETGAYVDTDQTLAGMPPLEGGEVMELEKGDLKIRACFVSAKREQRLEAIAAKRSDAAVITIVFDDAKDRGHALEIVESLAQRA